MAFSMDWKHPGDTVKSTLAPGGEFKSWVSTWPWADRFLSLDLSSDVHVILIAIWYLDVFFIGWGPYHIGDSLSLRKFYY